ncbi:hypothetical protein A2995_00870 [Candidatus Nomurabacteria bacterium RIFCSPLOWO2_01_FULL_33_24]|uniref:HTH deoR-type domain-containing protein n=1 Tax=Candidatus Nomurabacteria bacterium RIFCSPLOWO2_01_FULL_33_24 TaxID=1801765 RepID=A0A1F6X2V8_9BACT|nr:MAG: hypothetical protein A2995_00870 [Candidatus Nomurabacteria bacterium RIFCSPLOWO2_01_FULL_33_24]
MNNKRHLENKDSLMELIPYSLNKQEGAEMFSSTIKKTEKLITALYMVTDGFNKDEPLRARLRSLGVDLVSDIQSLSLKFLAERYFDISEIIEKINHILSFLKISASSGFMSEMNYLVLGNEFELLKNSVYHEQEQKESNKKTSSFTLSNNLLKKESFIEEQDSSFNKINTSSEKKENELSYKITSVTKHKGHPDNIIYKGQSKINKKDNKKTKQVFLENNYYNRGQLETKERKEFILKLIKEKKEIMIKDISKIISYYSEKTIQRDLLSLVNSGIIKKIGEKRWSKYSLT